MLRVLIREAMARRLAAPHEGGGHPTAAGGNVFVQRATPHMLRDLPAVGLYLTDEVPDDGEPGHPKIDAWRRRYTVAVEAFAPREDLRDRLVGEIERALIADVTLGGLVETLRWDSTSYDEVGGGATPVHAAGMTYTVIAWERAGAERAEGFVVPDADADWSDAVHRHVVAAPPATDQLVAVDAYVTDAANAHDPFDEQAHDHEAADPVLVTRETRVRVYPVARGDRAPAVYAAEAPEIGPDHADAYRALVEGD